MPAALPEFVDFKGTITFKFNEEAMDMTDEF